MKAPDPIDFELTEEEARAAASRAALRGALSEGLYSRHFAPLVLFALWIAFVAILGFTGLVARRATEIALILGAAAFMIQRLLSRRQLFAARRAAFGWAERARTAGPLALRLDADGLTLTGAGLKTRWRFADAVEIEDAGGLIYLWPRSGDPAFWPARAYPDAAAAEAWLAFARERIRRANPVAVGEEDDL